LTASSSEGKPFTRPKGAIHIASATIHDRKVNSRVAIY